MKKNIPPIDLDLLTFAVNTAKEAGELTLNYFKNTDLVVEGKGDGTPVTEADRDAERLMRIRIHEAFPNDTIKGEAGDDVHTGGAGADSITAGAGFDSINAGAGDDTIIFGSEISLSDSVDGGDGNDTVTATIDAASTGQKIGTLSNVEVATLAFDQTAGSFDATGFTTINASTTDR